MGVDIFDKECLLWRETSIGIIVLKPDRIKDGCRSNLVILGGVKYLARLLVLYLRVDLIELNMFYTVSLSPNCMIVSIMMLLNY